MHPARSGFVWPASLAGNIAQIELPGHPGTLAFTPDDAGLKVTLPAELPSDYAVALKITGLKLKEAPATAK
jgi:hypothetical protein